MGILQPAMSDAMAISHPVSGDDGKLQQPWAHSSYQEIV
jgi:hypothetical protein